MRKVIRAIFQTGVSGNPSCNEPAASALPLTRTECYTSAITHGGMRRFASPLPFYRAGRLKFRLGNSILIGLIAATFLSLLPASVQSQETIPEFKRRRGLIQKFGDKSDLVTFEPDGSKLKPNFDSTRNDNEGKLQAIRNAVGSYSSGSSSSGSTWSMTANGDNIEIKCGYGKSGREELSGNHKFWLSVVDNDGNSKAAIKVVVMKSGLVSIDYSANRGISFFRFRQLESGKIYCQDLDEEFAFSGNANSFDQFCRKHPAYARKRIEPIFKYLGMGVLPSRYADSVAKKVITDLKPVSDVRKKEFKKAIDGLNAGNFSEREEATKAFAKNFADWKDLIQSAISDEEFSVETRTRLKKIFEASVSEQEVGDLEIAQKGGLEDDASYLIWLLESADVGRIEIPDEVKPLLVARIEKLTGEKFGDDLEKWQSWLVKKSNLTVEDKPEASMTDAEILAIKGVFEKNSDHIRRLIKLNLEDGRLKLDREHWATPFAGKTIKELSREAKKKIAELNLPQGWLNEGGGYAIETSGFAQVLFERMKTTNPDRADSIYRNYQVGPKSTFNRTLNGAELTGALNTHKSLVSRRRGMFGGGGAKAPKQEFFELSLEEKNGKTRRSFTFLDSKEGDLLLSIDIPSKDAMLRIIQTKATKGEPEKSSCMVFDIRGPVVKRYSAASFAELQEKEQEYFDDLLLPVLKKLAIEIETVEASPESN